MAANGNCERKSSRSHHLGDDMDCEDGTGFSIVRKVRTIDYLHMTMMEENVEKVVDIEDMAISRVKT